MILGLTGNARVGKDTFALHLVRNYQFVRIGLADPMKRFCKEVFDFSYTQLWGEERDKPDQRYPSTHMEPKGDQHGFTGYLTPRYALQTLGTEWGRDCYSDVWIEYALRTAKRLLENPALSYSAHEGLLGHDTLWPSAGVVFSDLRFRNEVEAVKKAGGKVVRIYRDGFDGRDLGGVPQHSSEEEQRDFPDAMFDAVVHNPPQLSDYHRLIDKTVLSLMSR